MKAAETDTNECEHFMWNFFLSWILHFLFLGLRIGRLSYLCFGFYWGFEFIDLISLCVAVKAKAPDKAPADKGSSINQILGIKGAKQETVSHHFFFLLIFGN